MARIAIFLTAAFFLWAILYYGHWVLLRRRFVAIAPGKVYQSGAMGPRRLLRYARRFQIATVIDFRGAHEPLVGIEAATLAGTEIRHINIPLGVLPTIDDIRRFLEVMEEELRAGRRVLMHCKDGQGRAVALAAIYRIEFEGWSPEAAYRGGTRLPPGFKPISLLFPGAGLLSRRNCKTPFLLNYRPIRAAAKARTEACVSAPEV